MGKASSSKKVARAAKAAGRPGTKKNYAWPLAIGAVLVAGVVLVVASFGGGPSDEPPQVGDHWHAAYGVYDCDHYVAPFVDEAGDRTGIHTHQDGLMHIHPFVSRVVGPDASVDAFAEDVGMALDDDSIEAPGISRENGDECAPGEPGTLRLLTWDGVTDEEPQVVTEDLGSYAPPDGSVWVLAFAPEDAEIPPPDSAINLQDPTAAEEGREPPTATSLPEGEPEGDAEPEGDDTEPEPPADDATTTTAAP